MLERLKSSVRPVYHDYIRKPFILAASSVLQQTPISSEKLGPPKGIIETTKEWVESQNAKSPSARPVYQQIHDTEKLEFTVIKTVELSHDFYTLCEAVIDATPIRRNEEGRAFLSLPSTFVATLPGGRAYDCDGSVISADDYLLSDISLEYKRERYIRQKHKVMAQVRMPKMECIEGTVAVLATLSAHSFYSHWMMDLLRLWIL